MNNSIKTNRIKWVDLSKGILILLLVFAHCLEYYSTEKGISLWLLPVIYSFHVPAFFIISGFLFNPIKVSGFIELAKKSIKSILLPYITFSVLYTLFDVVKIYALHTNDDVSIMGDIKGFLIQKHFTTLWFLAALFIVELVAYFICKMDIKAIIVAIIVFGILGFVFLKLVNIWLPWCLDAVIFALPFFLFGYVIKKANIHNELLSLKLLPIFILVGLGAMYLNIRLTNIEYVHMWKMVYGNILLFYISAISNSLALFTITDKMHNIKAISYVGKNSLVYFGLHNLILTLVFHFLNRYNNGGYYKYLGLCLITLIVIMLVMSVVNEVFIKTPLCLLIGKKRIVKKREHNE